MARHATPAPFTTIALDPSSTAPLYRQLYDALRAMILSGRLHAGMRLPSTRTLARELGIARNTVVSAFDQLLAEGYLECVQRGGAFIAATLPDSLLDAGPRERSVMKRAPQRPPLSRRGASARAATSAQQVWPVMSDGLRVGREVPLAFDVALPALDAFPYKEWERLLVHRWRASAPDLLQHWSGVGYGPLRAAIAAYLAGSRGVQCRPEQVIVVDDSWQALDLTARVLLDPGDAAWIEDPGYLVSSHILSSAGIRPVPVPVDGRGLNVAAGIERCSEARLAVITPSAQWPLGVTMDAARRLALLRWTRDASAWVFENDNDSQYRFVGRPVAALQSLDQDGHVIYYGDFIIVLCRALSVGYLVVPPALVEAFTAAHFTSALSAPILYQAVLADFMAQGHLVRHMRRMRQLYASRRMHLVATLHREVGDLLDIHPAGAGACLIGWLPQGMDDRCAARYAAEQGVTVAPLSAYSMQPLDRGALIFGYAAVTEAHVVDGVRRLAAALRLSASRP